ncbi:MAG: hypothetical protein NTV25_02850 [Methanothrix sp.]|nr:hypothetical protein [Methanothrix sp.]
MIDSLQIDADLKMTINLCLGFAYVVVIFSESLKTILIYLYNRFPIIFTILCLYDIPIILNSNYPDYIKYILVVLALVINLVLDHYIEFFYKSIICEKHSAFCKRKLIVIIALILATTSLAYESMKLTEEGWQYYLNGSYDEAIASYDKAIHKCPINYMAHLKKGICSNSSQEGHACYNESIRWNPVHPATWYNKGIILLMGCHHNEALDCFNKSISYSTLFGDKNILFSSYERRGDLYLTVNNHNLAIINYERALNYNKQNCRVYLKLCNASKLSSYCEEYNKLKEKANDYFEDGYRACKEGKYEESINWYKKSMEIEPENATYSLAMVDALKYVNRTDEAIMILDEIIFANRSENITREARRVKASPARCD